MNSSISTPTSSPPAAQVRPIPTAPRMRLSHFFITTSLCTWTFYHRCCPSGLTMPPSECRREQRACHSMWLEARDDGTDDYDGEHPDIHQVGGVARSPDDANGKVHPDEDECCRERNADGGSVRDI